MWFTFSFNTYPCWIGCITDFTFVQGFACPFQWKMFIWQIFFDLICHDFVYFLWLWSSTLLFISPIGWIKITNLQNLMRQRCMGVPIGVQGSVLQSLWSGVIFCCVTAKFIRFIILQLHETYEILIFLFYFWDLY